MDIFCLSREMESNGAFNPYHEYPRRELKEQDLISQLELGSRNDSEEVDCTLQLGLPSGNGGKRPRIDVPNNIHATPPPQVYLMPISFMRSDFLDQLMAFFRCF